MRRTLVTRFTKVSKSGVQINFKVELLCGSYWVYANGMLVTIANGIRAAQMAINDYAEAV